MRKLSMQLSKEREFKAEVTNRRENPNWEISLLINTAISKHKSNSRQGQRLM
jgi:hypothetical protein